mmetsp:Transcript_30435/g.66418  ORF Transcript_30435/g.66418 Transcript_30435/m.66418 type:complete len:129 (-) Transcript_30435:103-489(-)
MMQVFQLVLTNEAFRHTKLACASTSDIPEYSWACLKELEVAPDVTLHSLFLSKQVGRINGSPDKYQHFANIQKDTGVEYKDMVFFDDKSEHIVNIYQRFGTIGKPVPDGMKLDIFMECLKDFAKSKEV